MLHIRETVSTPDQLNPWPQPHYRLCTRCQTVHDASRQHICQPRYHHSGPPSLAAAVAFLGLVAVFLLLAGVCVWALCWIWSQLEGV